MKPEEYLEKKIIPTDLKHAVIKAREASEAQKNFQAELKAYLEKCQRNQLRPKAQWLNLLQWLSEGRDMIDILEALQISPTSESFLEILESLKAHGFPDCFLNGLISEIPADDLDDARKENLRMQIPIELRRGERI